MAQVIFKTRCFTTVILTGKRQKMKTRKERKNQRKRKKCKKRKEIKRNKKISIVHE